MSKQTTATKDISAQSIDEWIDATPATGQPPAGYKAIDVKLADDRHARLIVPEDGLRDADLARVQVVATAAAERNRK
jgi:hypothetical protein